MTDEVAATLSPHRTESLVTPKNKNQQRDWEVWTPSTQVGAVMDDPLNAVLYESG